LRSSRVATAFRFGRPAAKLTTAIRVQATCSSQSLSIARWKAIWLTVPPDPAAAGALAAGPTSKATEAATTTTPAFIPMTASFVRGVFVSRR
jgi:hypothetical protein